VDVGKDVAVGGTVTVAVGDDIATPGSGVVGAAVPHPEMIKAMIATRNGIRFIEFSIEWNAPFILLLVPVDRIPWPAEIKKPSRYLEGSSRFAERISQRNSTSAQNAEKGHE